MDSQSPLARFALYYRTVTPQVMRRLEVALSERIPVADDPTRTLLAELDIHCPGFDSQLLDTYLRAFAERGLLPSPRIEVVDDKPAHAPTLLGQPHCLFQSHDNL